jgi:hypothetical protein
LTIFGAETNVVQQASGLMTAQALSTNGMRNTQDDEMLVSMASAHGGPGTDVDVGPEQLASDMELLYQVGRVVHHGQQAMLTCINAGMSCVSASDSAARHSAGNCATCDQCSCKTQLG